MKAGDVVREWWDGSLLLLVERDPDGWGGFACVYLVVASDDSDLARDEGRWTHRSSKWLRNATEPWDEE